MSLTLCEIATAPETRVRHRPVAELARARQVPSSKIRLLERYFRLRTAPEHPAPQGEMLGDALLALAAAHPDLRRGPGLLIHTRTQTHASHAAADWLGDLARAAGLGHWDVMAQTGTHCAGALAAMHLMRTLHPDHPVIVLAGEKCIHPTTTNQSGAVLGEMPTAALLRQAPPAAGGWRVTRSATRHMPEFNANPDRMPPALRKRWDREFGDYLEAFLQESLTRFDFSPAEIGLVVPYNLNLPLLERISERLGWSGITYTANLPRVGHLFCADVLFNLACVLPETSARRVFCFAAGMGATFSALVLERSQIAFEHAQERQRGRATRLPCPD